MILFFAQKITLLFIKNGADEENRELYEYGLLLILSNLITVSILFILSCLLGILKEMLCFLSAFVSVRHYAGGYHAKHYQNCFFISILSCLLGVYGGKYLYTERQLAAVLLLFSAAVIIKLAPIRPPERVLGAERAAFHKKMSGYITSFFVIISILLYYFKQFYWAGFFVTALLVTAFALIAGKFFWKA